MENKFMLRIGANTEKKYLAKLGTLFDSIIVRANYFASAPGMLSTMFLGLNAASDKKTGYVIDPVTYAFGLDPYQDWSIRSWQKIHKDLATKKLCEDLYITPQEIKDEWIAECDEKKDTDAGKVQVLSINKSYKKLAESFLPNSLYKDAGKRAFTPDDFSDAEHLNSFISNVIDYQKNAIKKVYDDNKYEDFKGEIPEPTYIIAPYFNMSSDEMKTFTFKIWEKFVAISNDGDKKAVIIHSPISFIAKHQNEILQKCSELKIKNILLWIDNFIEEMATLSELKAYAEFVKKAASQNINVINMYAGGFSMLLLASGLAGISNSPGYGMHKETEPVKGGVPSAKYYIPDLYARYPVGKAYDMMQDLELIEDGQAFINNICNCPICREVMQKSEDISDFISFYGEWMESKGEKKKKISTSAAIERCAYHFVLTRLSEYNWAIAATQDSVLSKLNSQANKWNKYGLHLLAWRQLLSEV